MDWISLQNSSKLSRNPTIIIGDRVSVKIKRRRSRAMAQPFLPYFYRGSDFIHKGAVKVPERMKPAPRDPKIVEQRM